MNGLAEFISLAGAIAGIGFLIYLFREWLGEKKKQTPNPVPDLTEDEPALPSSGGLIDDLRDDDDDLFNDPPISVPGDIGEELLDMPRDADPASPVEDTSPGVYEEIGDGAGRGEDKLDDYPSLGSDSADSFCGSGNEDESCGASDDSSSRDEDPPTDV